MTTYLKATGPTGLTRHEFHWPDSGVVECSKGILPGDHVCPRQRGDGVSVAKTFAGMALGGYSAASFLEVEVDAADVLGEDKNKLRVSRARVIRRVSIGAWLKEHPRANLYCADLYCADLTSANLTNADLTDANLTRADLTDADLTSADLTRADLTRANLYCADLTNANLTDADLTNANLTNAKGANNAS